MQRIQGCNSICSLYAPRERLFVISFIAAILLGVIFFAGAAGAQDQNAETTGSEAQATQQPVAQSTPVNATAVNIKPKQAPQEVVNDFTISLRDLEVGETGILPDSPFHAFKRIGWGLHEAFTFGAVADAELKLKHASQYLGEAKQLIDARGGIDKVDPGILSASIDRFEKKFTSVKNRAQSLVQEKTSNPQAVEDLLNKVTDKQIKQQQVLDGIADGVVKAKRTAKQRGEDSDLRIESVIAKVEDTKGKSLKDFTEILTTIDSEPEKIRIRIEQNLERQGGSEFKSLKNLELLETIHDQAPANIKEALKKAKKNTIQRFEVRVSALPEQVRKERFKNYVTYADLDETRLVSLLDEIKQSTSIPDDLLAKIEEAKEIAVRRFEDKLSVLDDVQVEERFFRKFDTDEVGDLIALEEFKNRMSAGSDELRTMQGVHDRSIQEFKRKFKDTDSQAQAERFQKLSDQFLNNPSAKTFKLIAALEEDVRSDPAKSQFLDQMENALELQFETQFRRQGDKFLNRITTLDPHDLAIFETRDFGDDFRASYVAQNTGRFKAFMQDVDEPEQFDRFHERFFNVGDFVINEIRERDTEFQDAMQFKVRKMEEVRAEKEREIARARLDFEEREIFHQSDRLQRQKELEKRCGMKK
jgi:hypothetical protein